MYPNHRNDSTDPRQNYELSQCGPWGIQLNDHIKKTARFNVPFDNLQWEEVKLNGCHGRPCRPLPQWPPPQKNGFIYPSLPDQEKNPPLLGTYGYGNQSVFMEGKPFLDPKPVPPSPLPPSKQQYTPEDIIGYPTPPPPQPPQPKQSYDQAIPGSSYRSTPSRQMYSFSDYL